VRGQNQRAASAAIFAYALTNAAAAAPAPQTAPFPPPIPAPRDEAYPGVITVDVDARDVARGIVTFRQRIPVKGAGPLTLLYPEWLPGNHAPRGQIDKIAGLEFSAKGKPLAWRRDPVNIYAFHVDVPNGVSAIDLKADYLSPTATAQGRVVVTREMANLQWNSTVLYPAGYAAAEIKLKPSVRLPEGWGYASALTPKTGRAPSGAVAFAATDLEAYVDSPMFAGAFFRSYDLDPGSKTPVMLNIVADEAQFIAPTDAQLEAHRNLVKQADLLFGARHFDRYDFLLALSDRMGGIGLEHHRSSENGVGQKYFLDPKTHVNSWDLLPHEYVHSWNGKFRRPADLYTDNFDVPMRGSLLWVYEGMTSYWGEVLAARSGMFSKEDALASLAMQLANFDNRPGRQWRPVSDTTLEPVISARRPQPWVSYQRAEDYYYEGFLTWLDADTLIREKTGGAKSLDDFAKAFFGVEPGRVEPLTYTFGDVVATLNAVMPHDWATFLRERIETPGRPAPIAGAERGGWRLVYGDEPNSFIAGDEKRLKTSFFTYSLGFTVGEGSKLANVLWEGLAFKQNLRVGDELISVNGAAYTAETLQKAITAAKDKAAPIEIIVKSGDQYRTAKFDYRGGLRYPRLERIPGTEDRLSAIYAARAK
jgi:predicted metalloprotease with PDZ domain